jgi:hypothetical protein
MADERRSASVAGQLSSALVGGGLLAVVIDVL